MRLSRLRNILINSNLSATASTSKKPRTRSRRGTKAPAGARGFPQAVSVKAIAIINKKDFIGLVVFFCKDSQVKFLEWYRYTVIVFILAEHPANPMYPYDAGRYDYSVPTPSLVISIIVSICECCFT